MRKRLLLQLLAVVCTMGVYAYNVGDYIYSAKAKFQITGLNQVTNGCFNVGDGFEGWTNETGGTLNGDVWSVGVGLGMAEGENVIRSLGSSDEAGSQLFNVWSLEPGSYAISFWIKGAGSGSTTVGVVNNNGDYTTPGDNYINFFLNNDGTTAIVTPVSTGQSFSDEWRQIVVNVDITSGFLVFNAKKVETDVMMTRFEIYPVQQVYDSRNLQRELDYIDKLYADENLPDKSELEEPRAALMAMLAQPGATDDVESMEGLMISVQEAITKFLDANAGDTESGDWTTRSSINWNNLNNATIVGSWSTVGDRWGFSANDGSLERPANDGYVASCGIQRSYNHEGKGVKVSRTDLPAGKYFFSIEAQATAAANNTQPYGSNNGRPVVGPTIYIGSTQVVLENDTLNDDYWKRFYLIADIGEGETVEAGFTFPSYTDGLGGRYSVRNPEFRQIGRTTTEIRWGLRVGDVITQQAELKTRIDTYPNDVADCYWGKARLNDTLAVALQEYNNSLNYVSNGTSNVDVTDEGVELLTNLKATLLAEVQKMNRAKNWVININAIQNELKAEIATSNASLGNEGHSNADATKRATLTEKVSVGQGLMDALSVIDDQEQAIAKNDEYTAAKQAIRDARQFFEMSCATYEYPAELQVQNGGFEAWTSNTNYGSDTSANGWNFICGTDIKQWQLRPGTTGFESGVCANAWRGTTVAPMGKASQKITVSLPGLYEYRAKAYAVDDNFAQFLATGGIIYTEIDDDDVAVDTIYRPNVMLFFGPDGAPDSICVSKNIAPERAYKDWNGYKPLRYSVFYNKTTDTEETLEFGLESFSNEASVGVNGFGFGDNKVYYVGSEAQYVADSKAKLDAEIANAKTMIQGRSREEDWMVWKIRRYLFDGSYPKTKRLDTTMPTTAKGIKNALISLLEMENLLDSTIEIEPSGISEINANDAVKVYAKNGIYSITGIKVAANANNLRPGLYVINGRKVVIK